MDSPEPAKTSDITSTVTTIAATALSDSPSVQESPFTNYVSNLSPIKPVRAPHPVQGYVGVASPPLVFTSPRIISHRETSFLQRSQLSQIYSAETHANDDGNNKVVDHSDDHLEKSVTYCSRLIADTQKDNDVENSPQDQPGSSSGFVDEFLRDPVDADCANSQNLVNSNAEQSNDVLQSSASHEQVEEDPQGQSTLEIKPIQVEEVQSSIKQPSNKFPNIESDLPSDNAPEQYDDSEIQMVQACELYSENLEATLQGDIQNVAKCDSEASQLQRGFSRRCLQFEEAQKKIIVNSTSSPNLTKNVTSSGSPASAADLESLDPSHVGITESSQKKQMINLSRTMTSMFPLRRSGKSPIVASKPSGIGLHLNSIVNALPMGHTATASMKSTPIMSFHQVDYNNSSLKLIAPEDRMLEIKASPVVEPLNMLQPLEHQVTPLNKRKFSSEHVDNFEEFSQLSPTKNKSKKASSIDGDGCKRCNCKKTKCLKLYCDCFAAGMYCADPCACQGCFNRPEYEDTVLETRQQIESRNPLAFAPKVVEHATEAAAVSREDGSRSMSSLARHKRGCNCKRSMCLKKYCECYQENVGCSTECRCEGCKNVYGRKEEYGMTEEMVSNRVSEERLEGRVDDKLGMVATNKDLLHAESYDLHNLTPSTPSFQHSDHGKDAPKSRLNSSRYAPSPESEISVLTSHAKSLSSPSNSQHNMIPKRSKEIQEVDSCSQDMDYNIAEMMDQFSPRCNTLADICDLTPLQNTLTSIASSASSKPRDWSSSSRLQLCPGSGRLSSGRSLRWRSSPITPMTRLGENKNLGHDSDSGLYDILEDDTPEILKEASIPIPSVKASSPNKKRISPPYKRIHDLRSSTSAGLRSGRKFILKAVPSFPPLTPCTDSKDSTNEKQ
ncbi:hypothetical protein JCGZ_07197 [Jatropha curcas]|uniref:CRC domain-containing protein n=1 Tax=Jatropha curcas TaxID=180498 RepID=A0A067KBM5_JATCU|nr:hypothetical protein JCGZ_07197 [Jatropha curcas]